MKQYLKVGLSNYTVPEAALMRPAYITLPVVRLWISQAYKSLMIKYT